MNSLKNKKAAMELTMGTMVTIVLVVSALILGLILIQKIFLGATESVDSINDKVMDEINNLFASETSDVMIMLGGSKTASIKPNGKSFGVAIAARSIDGRKIKRTDLQYKISIDEGARENCVTILKGKDEVEKLIKQKTEEWLDFDSASGSIAGAAIIFEVPKGTAACSQKILIDVRDTETDEAVGSEYFIIEILKSRFF